jgi:hypothetical protein
MGGGHSEYDDASDLINDSLGILAQRRAKYAGDDLVAITLLAALMDTAGKTLAARVQAARDHGHTWQDIGGALTTSPVEARLRFDHQLDGCRPWLHER